MSLLNVYLFRNRAVVAVDTLALRPDGSPADVSKMLTLPHSGVVIAVRGEIRLAQIFQQVCFHLIDSADLDNIAVHIGYLMTQAHKRLVAEAASEGMNARISGIVQELAVVGWSVSLGRVAVVRCIGTNPSDYKIKEVKTSCFGPNLPGYDPTEDAEPPEDGHNMLRVARLQVAYAKEAFPGDPIGGRLILAEVTKGRVAISEAGTLS